MSLLAYFLFMCVAMTLVPLPTDPLIANMGSRHPPLLIAAIGTLGTCVAASIEYFLLAPILRMKRLNKFFKKAPRLNRIKELARDNMFMVLLVAGFTPLPFDPFRLLAIAIRYPIPLYLMAIILGRTPRYYLFAVAGDAVQFPTWAMVALVVLILLYGWVHYLRQKRENKDFQSIRDVIFGKKD